MRVVVAAFAAAALAGECSAWSGAATVTSSYGIRSLSMTSSREPQQGGGLMSRRAATAGLAAALLAGGSNNARAEGEAPKIPESEMIKPPTTSCAQVSQLHWRAAGIFMPHHLVDQDTNQAQPPRGAVYLLWAQFMQHPISVDYTHLD